MNEFEQPTLSETKRATNAYMESILCQPHDVLDHGFLRVIDYMGDEDAIVQAARNSYGRGTKSRGEDTGLIRNLMRNYHTSPFEMCEIKLHVKMPLFVARQWIRHRMASVNEMSARYSILDKEFYIPEADALAPQSTLNKQGRNGGLTEKQARMVQRLMRDEAERAYLHYETLLREDREGETNSLRERLSIEHGDLIPTSAQVLNDDEHFPGLARELARMGLSLNFYTQWYWKVDLKNFMDFLRLRNDAHAQYEIRVYAELMQDILRGWMPRIHEAFCDFRQDSVTLSGPAIEALRGLLAFDATRSDTRILEFRHKLGLRLGKSEIAETMKALGLE